MFYKGIISSPENNQQNTNGERSHISNLDPLKQIYNVSLISSNPGISGLSEDDSLSCPPSPAVSSIQDEEF